MHQWYSKILAVCRNLCLSITCKKSLLNWLPAPIGTGKYVTNSKVHWEWPHTRYTQRRLWAEPLQCKNDKYMPFVINMVIMQQVHHLSSEKEGESLYIVPKCTPVDTYPSISYNIITGCQWLMNFKRNLTYSGSTLILILNSLYMLFSCVKNVV